MNSVMRTFVRGLVVVLPVVITAYAVRWMATSAESTLGALLRRVLPDELYVTGMGIVAGVALVLAIGVLARVWILRKLGSALEAVVERVPLVKTLYGSVKDLMGFFSQSTEKRMGQVVSVAIPGLELNMLGFVTREDFDDHEGIPGGEDRVAVYLPMSYQVGGFTVMVARDSLTEVDMTVEECLRFAMTAGVTESRRDAVPDA